MKSEKYLLSLTGTLIALLALVSLATGGMRPVSAGTQEEEKIVVSIANDALGADYSLYTLNPDGTAKTKIFDFSGHPKDPQAAIWQPRIAPGGGTIYFTSDNAYLWTPASRNLFRIASDGSWWDQITPGPNSGKWNQPCPCGVVQGTVKKSNGDPWVGAPVYLEGMDMQNTDANGAFRFESVPEGKRSITAYESLASSTYDTQEVTVVAGATWTANLVPAYDVGYLMEFQHPAFSPSGDRIYHTLGINKVQWTDVNALAYTQVYAVSGICYDVDVDGFDVAPTSGKLAIMDFGTGCDTNRGLYTADKDGNNVQLLVDMKADPNWSGGKGVFWSPDESKLAFLSEYSYFVCLTVYSSAGSFQGWACLGTQQHEYNLINVDLHGWSPDGGWLLFSYWKDDAAKVTLSKVKVDADGSVDTNEVKLLTDTYLGGATWGNLTAAGGGHKIYLPLIVRRWR
jgi:hypothetical protein